MKRGECSLPLPLAVASCFLSSSAPLATRSQRSHSRGSSAPAASVVQSCHAPLILERHNNQATGFPAHRCWTRSWQ